MSSKYRKYGKQFILTPLCVYSVIKVLTSFTFSIGFLPNSYTLAIYNRIPIEFTQSVKVGDLVRYRINKDYLIGRIVAKEGDYIYGFGRVPTGSYVFDNEGMLPFGVIDSVVLWDSKNGFSERKIENQWNKIRYNTRNE